LDCRSRSLGRQRRGAAASCNNDGHSAADQISGKFRKSLMLTLGPAIFDRDILALNVTNFAKATMERGQELRELGGGCIGKVANHRHRRLLRPRHQRPRHRDGKP
jgi:hypothetical protein